MTPSKETRGTLLFSAPGFPKVSFSVYEKNVIVGVTEIEIQRERERVSDLPKVNTVPVLGLKPKSDNSNCNALPIVAPFTDLVAW